MPPNKQRRVFMVLPSRDRVWIVSAEGGERLVEFSTKNLAVGYAGLWAAENPPSQVLVRDSDGGIEFGREYD
jgi:hypothetical protein